MIPHICFTTSETVTFLTISNIFKMFCFLLACKHFVLNIWNYFLSLPFVKFKSDTGSVMRGVGGPSLHPSKMEGRTVSQTTGP
jgi:hypothetical protein